MMRIICIILCALCAVTAWAEREPDIIPAPSQRADIKQKAERYARFMDSQAFAKEPRDLHIKNLHNGEDVKLLYHNGSAYVEPALEALNYVLRDRRNDEHTEMDPATLDTIYALTQIFDYDGPVEIISAYRSPETNAHLRKKSRGVAKNSRHMHGEAIDIRLKDVNMTLVRDAAMSLSRGGVGYYYNSNFVHVDSGPVRSWGSPAPYEQEGDGATRTASNRR